MPERDSLLLLNASSLTDTRPCYSRHMAGAGWYEDPNDELRQRYFDGEAWTRQTRGLPLPRTPTTTPEPPVQAASGVSESSRWPERVPDTPWSQSAFWIVAEMHAQSLRHGSPMAEDAMVALFSPLRTPVLTSAQAKRLNNYSVPLIRAACENAKRAGSELVKVRRWLRLTPAWIANYQTLIDAPDADILLHGIIQNAFLSNPAAGETEPWRSW